jgi:hypothetical protein
MSVVRWVPLYRADLSLPVEPRDLVRVLRRNVAPAWPSMPFWSSREPYFGEVSGDSFLVRPVGVAVSALRPVIVGTIAAREGGSRVTFTSRPSWFATFAMIATVTLFLVFDGALVVQEWNAGRPLRIAMLLPVALSFALYSIWVLKVTRAGRHFEEFLPQLHADRPDAGRD